MAHDDRSAVEVLTPHHQDGKTRHPSPTHDLVIRGCGVVILSLVALFAAQFFLIHSQYESRSMLPVLAIIAFGMLYLTGLGFHLLFGRDHA